MISSSAFKIVRYCCLSTLCFYLTNKAGAMDKKPSQEFYSIRVYHFKNGDQEKSLDSYLKNAFLPGLHRMGIAHAGVFKPLANDTAADKLIYVFFPIQSFEQLLNLPSKLAADNAYNQAGADFINAVYNNPSFVRMESILLKAFRLAPHMEMPGLNGPQADRIYELRSYESPSEKLYENKVHMFNEGGEVPLFKRLAFNAVFYAEVISGSHMPNLMYMTSFDNIASREQHWKTFSADPEWKHLSGLPEYQHNVSKAEIILLHATDYSDI